MIKYFPIILILILISSCDYFNSTRICNSTPRNIKIKIEFDSINLSNKHLPKNEFLKRFHEWSNGMNLLEVDTINNFCIYQLPPDSCCEIEGGNNRRPFFDDFSKITIISTDTIILDTKDKMREAFNADRKNTEYYFDLVIK